MAISCTLLIDENSLSTEEIDQELVVIKEGICTDDICDYNDSEIRHMATSILIEKKWDVVRRTMNLERMLKPYNLGSHNCCTVAYKAAIAILDGDKNKVKEMVDPKTFNVYGMGVVWNNYILKSSWGLGESSSSSSHSSKEVSEKISASSESIEDDFDSTPTYVFRDEL